MEARKVTIFNMNNPREKMLHDLAQEHVHNWSKWTKKNLEQLAKRYGVTLPDADNVLSPVPDKQMGTGAYPRQTEK